MAYTKSKAVASKGFAVNINIGTASAPTWTPVFEMAKLTLARKNMTDSTTNFQSTAEEHTATMPDGGDVKGSGNYVALDPGQVAMETAFASGALMPFQFIAPMGVGQSVSGDTWAGSGIVTELNPEFDATKKIGASFTIQISNGLTKTAGS